MKFFSKGEAVYDTQLYNYFVTVGSYIEETLLELKKENNDSFNMYFDEVTRLVSIKKDDYDMRILIGNPIIFLNKTIKLLEVEEELISKYNVYNNSILLDKIKKLKEKDKTILQLEQKYNLHFSIQEIKDAHIIYMLDTIIDRLKQKKYFKFAYYTSYSKEKNYDIFIRNTIKQFKNIINVVFNEATMYIDVMDDFCLNYRMHYDSVIKLMLCAKIKYLNMPDIKNGEIAICEECNYFFYRGNTRKKHCDRDWCRKNYQSRRKRKERAKNVTKIGKSTS